MIKFYSVTFTNKLGHTQEQFVVGTEKQINDWAIAEASNYGFAYEIKYVCSNKLEGIKNLCNY